MNWNVHRKQNFFSGGNAFDEVIEAFRIEAENKKTKYYRLSSASLKKGTPDYLPLKRGKKYNDLVKEIISILGDEHFISNNHMGPVLGCVITPDSYLNIEHLRSSDQYLLNFISFDIDKCNEIQNLCYKYFNFKQKKNSKVYMLTSTTSGLQMTYMGSFKRKLQVENYPSKVVSSFKECISQIKSKTPRGRMSVFYGPPGTGKTYLLRSLINEIENAIFVSVQPEVFTKYSAADIMSPLSNYRDSKIILLIEDADSILCDRKNNSENVVSNVLNFTDGFMGECLNTHLLCTTNIQKLEIDKAYRRKGRLNTFLEIGPLSIDEAQKAYNSIDKKNKPDYIFTKPAILADIYAIANEQGYEEEDETIITSRIGFIPDRSIDNSRAVAKQ